MKIILVYQADSDMEWAPGYDAAGFERAAETERSRGAAPASVRRGDASAYKVWVSSARAARETAELLFEMDGGPEVTPLLDDVLMRAFRDGDETRPLWLWKTMGRAQWLLGGRRQPESRRETAERAGRFADSLEAEDRDCIVITRGLIMGELIRALRRRGYVVEGGNLIPRPLDRLRAVKQSVRCGGCSHNCPLSNPRCDVGRNKAKERKI